MRWSITIGSVGGTAVKIHITFILFRAARPDWRFDRKA
jgi:hypothetical protein